MKDEDIYAFNPVPPPVAPPPRPARRVWPWVLGAGAVLMLALLVAGGAALLSWLGGAHEGVHVSIDGEDWRPGAEHGLVALLALCGVGVGLLVALLAVGLVVPLTLALVFLGLALGAGGVVLALALVAAVVLSPLWLVVLLLWLLLRPRRGARMQA